MAIDLLLDLAEAPVRYDPTRGSLHAYLTMAAAAQGILKVAHDVPVYSADGNAVQCFNPLNG